MLDQQARLVGKKQTQKIATAGAPFHESHDVMRLSESASRQRKMAFR
jgi:hypothetical protein